MDTSWEADLAQLLTDLLAVQDELLVLIGKKRDVLESADADGLAALGVQEEQLVEKLQDCMRRREQLLARAAEEGLPADNLQALSQALPRERRTRLDGQLRLARSRGRLLQLQSLTNWVVVQRTLIHLSQMLEIIATGGRPKPTYGEGEQAGASGALVDRAA